MILNLLYNGLSPHFSPPLSFCLISSLFSFFLSCSALLVTLSIALLCKFCSYISKGHPFVCMHVCVFGSLNPRIPCSCLIPISLTGLSVLIHVDCISLKAGTLIIFSSSYWEEIVSLSHTSQTVKNRSCFGVCQIKREDNNSLWLLFLNYLHLNGATSEYAECTVSIYSFLTAIFCLMCAVSVV